MNLLVIGRHPQVPMFFRSLDGQAGQNVVFCPGGHDALDLCRRTEGGMDWIFFVGMPRGEIMKTIRRMRGAGITSPIIMCQTPEAADADAAMSPVLVGIFERASHESTLLGCNLVGMETGQGERERFSPDEILLEYHVPCAAGNGR